MIDTTYSGHRQLAELKPGDHLCWLYQTEEEHQAVITPFLRQGLEREEKVVYIVDAHTDQDVLGYLRRSGLDVEPFLARGQLSVVKVGDTYLRDGVFSPEGMIGLLRAETAQALAEGYQALRATGEMSWALRGLPGAERLIEYEAKLNTFFPGSRCLAICQYDRRRFPPEVLQDVLATHPLAMVGTEVYDNFYYVPPGEFLGSDRAADTLKRQVQNLAQQQRAAEQLRKLSRAVEQSPATVVITDVDGNIEYANPKFSQTTGYTLDEALGKNPRILKSGETPSEEYAQMWATIVSGGEWHGEFHNRKKNGELYWEAASVSSIRNLEGEITHFLAVKEDITERKQAEETLRRTRDYLESLFNYANAPIIVWDPDFKITRFNHAFEHLTGHMAADVIGRDLHVLFPETSREESLDKIARTLTGEYWESVEIPIRRQDGEIRVALWNSANIYADDSRTLLATIAQGQDITERKQAEERIRGLNQDLVRRAAELDAANKELEAFSYSVSHDLRAPLRSIDGFSLALLEDYRDKLDEQGLDYLRRVRAGTQRMSQLIDDLLALSRTTRAEIRREEVDLSRQSQSIAADLQKTQPERQVEFVVAPGLVANGDARLLRVVLENLLGNAWKFTAKHAQARIEFGVVRQEGMPAYFVKDDGAGFNMAFADKLFGAFQRLHSASEFTGTGIGLATVQRIIHRHGGRVWAEGAVEQGATFYFTL